MKQKLQKIEEQLTAILAEVREAISGIPVEIEDPAKCRYFIHTQCQFTGGGYAKVYPNGEYYLVQRNGERNRENGWDGNVETYVNARMWQEILNPKDTGGEYKPIPKQEDFSGNRVRRFTNTENFENGVKYIEYVDGQGFLVGSNFRTRYNVPIETIENGDWKEIPAPQRIRKR